jgi:hypothetical protein
MGDHDALLAVATNTKLYAFTAPPNVLSPDGLNSLRTKQIEPAVAAKDWSGAAVAAADGLNKSASPASSSKRNWVPIAIGVAVVVLAIVVIFVLYRMRRRRRAARRVDPGGGQLNIDSLGQALTTAESRLRQISDYAAKHRESIGADAQTRLEEAKRHLAAAHGTQTTSDTEAIAYANRASTLAAQAQTLANADVAAAHRPRRRGSASTR